MVATVLRVFGFNLYCNRNLFRDALLTGEQAVTYVSIFIVIEIYSES